MTRRFPIALGLCLACTWTATTLDAKAEGGKLGVDGAFVLPIGDWSDVSGVGIGALFYGDYNLSPEFAVTGRVGYIHHLSKSVGGADFSTYEIPILGGVKYRLGEPGDGLYLAGEAGLVSLGVKGELTNPISGEKTSASDSEMEIGLTGGVGYEMGDLDFRGQVFFPSLDELGDFMGVLATVGYRFTEF